MIEVFLKIYIPVLSIRHHGGTKILCELADYIDSSADELSVEIICPKGSFDSEYLNNENLVKEIGIKVNNKYLEQLLFLFATVWYLKGKTGVLIANFFVTWYPCFISTFIGNFKLVYFIQGVDGVYKGKLGRLLNYASNLTFKYNKQHIIPANKYLAQYVTECNSESIEDIEYTVGLNRVFFDPFKVELINKKYDFCYFGRHEPWKRLDRFFDLLEHLIINGVVTKILFISKDHSAISDTKRQLKEMNAHQSKVEVDFVSPTSQKKLCQQIRKAKFFVGTSEAEGFYLPPLECMSQAVFPVLYDCGGPRIYINDNENGKFVNSTEEIFEFIYSPKKIAIHNSYETLHLTAEKFSSDHANEKFRKFLVCFADK
jgi:glycosyltransferase involved in cell wall biosynthesis